MDSLALRRIGGTNVLAIEGDVTRQQVQAVVNAANETLQHKEGVATAIVRTGGRVIQEESDTWVRDNGPVEPGSAAVTTGGMLHASHVIHAVGPHYTDGETAEVLADAVTAALDLARDNGLSSVALPAISAGRRGYPADEATRIVSAAVAAWLAANPEVLTEVRLVGLSAEVASLFAAALEAGS